MLKNIIVWIWSPIIMLGIAIGGMLAGWESWITVVLMSVVLVAGVAVAIITAAERENEKISGNIRQLASHFTRRFGGESSYSIFAIIRELFRTQDPELWEYAHSCEQTERVYNTWSENFISRMETDSATGRYTLYIRRHLQELWMLNNHYHEYIEQLRDIAEKVNLPTEMIEQYNRFSAEYNSFVNSFREIISSGHKSGKTNLEANSVKDAIYVGATTVPGLNTNPQPITYSYVVTQPAQPQPATANPSFFNKILGGNSQKSDEQIDRREYGGESYREESSQSPIRPAKSDPRDEYELMRRANYEKRAGIKTKSTAKPTEIPSEEEYSSIATRNSMGKGLDDNEYRRFTY